MARQYDLNQSSGFSTPFRLAPNLCRTWVGKKEEAMNFLKGAILTATSLLLFAPDVLGQELQAVRVASYNIRFLSNAITTQGDRRAKLQEVISRLDADVIGLQEINDRAALNLIFPPQDWHVVIDDDSAEEQDVAVVVRKPLRVIGLPSNLDADNEHFLFPESSNNSFFPDRRDLLFVEIGLPNQTETFFVMVHHSKARVGGRATTDPRREGAAREIVRKLRDRFEDKNFILLGDMNDNPDDRSMNILETGDFNALGGPEEIDGPFLINLMEPLVAAGHVSHGRTSDDIVGDRVNTIDPTSRQRNNNARGTNQNTGDILFDQLLIPGWMGDKYVAGSAKVFDHEVAVRGSSSTRASDHLPVYADFEFGVDEPDETITAQVKIFSLLPNPTGNDPGREEVTIINLTSSPLSLAGWKLRDANTPTPNEFALSGTVPANGKLTVVMASNTMPLNNGGDSVSLVDPQGNVRHQVSYASSQATPGRVIIFQ
jgi:endonuclease/exonuclease/phosphatase family metal-dependent hydrolase